jgi:hypothetical protein
VQFEVEECNPNFSKAVRCSQTWSKERVTKLYTQFLRAMRYFQPEGKVEM